MISTTIGDNGTHAIRNNIEYDIVDIDYWENDAVLVVGENRYYFQWSDTSREPTIVDALDFMKKECIVKVAR
jgi:hypothetical protein